MNGGCDLPPEIDGPTDQEGEDEDEGEGQEGQEGQEEEEEEQDADDDADDVGDNKAPSKTTKLAPCAAVRAATST